MAHERGVPPVAGVGHGSQQLAGSHSMFEGPASLLLHHLVFPNTW